MNQFAGLVAIFVLFLDASVDALECGRGTRLEIPGDDKDSITNSQCQNSNEICHRLEATASVFGVSCKYPLQIYLKF